MAVSSANERVHGPEDAGLDSLAQDVEERIGHGDPHAGGRAIEMAARFAQLAHQHAGKVRPGGGLADEGLDERDQLRLGRCRRVAHRPHARADGGERAPDDLAVEGLLAGEVVVEHRLREPRGAGDAIDTGAGEALRGELRRGGGDQAVARGGAGKGAGTGHRKLEVRG